MQVAGANCNSRGYSYDSRTNRTAKRLYTGCQLDAATSEETHSYDTADRIMDAGYVHDAFGRITSTPGGLTTTYFANDLVAGQQLGDTKQNWTLDPLHRFRGFSTSKLIGGMWTNATSKLNHYGDDSDEPRWVVEDSSGTLTRNVSGPDGDLIATTSATGGVQLQLTNLHGDVAMSIDTGLTAPEAYSYDEFGIPDTVSSDRRYGWLGGKQRSGDALGDIVLMGVRLYSPSLGRFLQVDPIPGGNSNAYDYCSGDAVNCTDLDGNFGWGSIKKALNKVAVVASYASMIPGPIGTFAGIVSAVAYVATGNWKEAAWAVGGALAATVGAGAAVKGARMAVKAVKLAKRATGCPNSFAPGTQVQLADGSFADIDSLAEGVLVLAVDPVTGQTRAEPVLNVIVGQGTRHLVAITVDGGAPLVATAGHPVYVLGRGWVEAGDVHAGDRLIGPDGRPVRVIDVTDHGWVAGQTVYNLSVADLHTYVVQAGDQPVVVHNCGSTVRGASKAWHGFKPPKRSTKASKSGNGFKGKTYVYEIGYKTRGGHDVYKYGIASGKINKAIRTRIGVARCVVQMKRSCSVTGMQSFPTRMRARQEEWRKCVSYYSRKLRTPHGMPKCR